MAERDLEYPSTPSWKSSYLHIVVLDCKSICEIVTNPNWFHSDSASRALSACRDLRLRRSRLRHNMAYPTSSSVPRFRMFAFDIVPVWQNLHVKAHPT